MATCAVLAFGGAASGQDAPKPGTAQQPPAGSGVPATTAKAVTGSFSVNLHGIGTVQPFYSVLLKPRVDGTLMRVPVTEGQEVKQGDLIAVIDPRPYQAALDQAMAKKAQDEAQLANARADLARYASLATKDFASHQQVDTQQAAVNQFTAAIKGDDAAIAAAQLNLSFCYLLAPFDGRVGLRAIDPGNFIRAGDPGGLLTINQVRPISVVFTLPQDNLPDITAAMTHGKLAVAAFSTDDKTKLADGELLTPDNAIDTGTGTIRLKAVFLNPDNKLWPGQFVNAHLLVATLDKVVMVPSAAVQHGPDGLYVYGIGPDRAVVQQPVTVSQDDGHNAVVAKGLDAGAEVVTAGQSRLQVGMRVAEGAPKQGG